MLTERFDRAFILAAQLHREQTRKGREIPYLSHLMAVAALVIQNGGDEDQAIAALLHDAVEDQGGRPTLERISREFGDRVARIVDGCTDTDVEPKPEWRPRKELYIAHLRKVAPEVRLVSLADKVHNARSILADHYRVGPAVWERFKGKRDGTLWYYQALLATFRELDGDTWLVRELERLVKEMSTLP